MASKFRQELEKYRETILKIFDYRCIRCGGLTREIHEIVPISHGKKAQRISNRVPLCGGVTNSCHEWAHAVGTRVSIPILQTKREEFLKHKWEQRKNKWQTTIQTSI